MGRTRISSSDTLRGQEAANGMICAMFAGAIAVAYRYCSAAAFVSAPTSSAAP
ncbi:MAG: hypothetical protein WAL63_16585 [Solirubrobacteraceae bacterium]